MRNAALLGGCLLACLLTGPVRSQAAPKPATAVKNVLFIISDDLKASVLGCYGDPRCKTPNIDKLAKEGMRFTDAHAAAANGMPTRYGVLTGRYPCRIGQYGVL